MQLPDGWVLSTWDHLANEGHGPDEADVVHSLWSVWRESDGLVVASGQGKPPTAAAIRKAIKENR